MFGPYIDLHVHSNYSDGKRSLEYIKDKVKENGLRTIALAEHYNLSSYYRFRRLVGKEIEVIPATEFSASLNNFGLSKKHICHIAAYFPSFRIYSIFDYYELSREKCASKTLELLRKEGINISKWDVIKSARNKESVGRFDIATTLFKKGYAPTPEAAYQIFFDKNSPVYIDREKLEASDLIKKILYCKGVPVLVHPKSLKLNDSDFIIFLTELKKYGLCGIESYNPHNTSQKAVFYRELGNDLGLISTVGSDYHGRSNEHIEIGLGIEGNLRVSNYKIIIDLKSKKKELFD